MDTELLLRGIMAVTIGVLILYGSIWVLLSMVLGWRLGYWVMGACFFGIMILLSAIWFGTALGPKGPETTWHPVAIGPDLATVEGFGGSFDVSAYPGGDWEAPRKGRRMADLKGSQDTSIELQNVKPVLETFVSTAVSPIPGRREQVKDLVVGSVELKSGSFAVVDFRFREAEAEGKDSIVVAARAVPSQTLTAGSLGGGADEGEIVRYLVAPGDTISPGQPVLVAETGGGQVQVSSDGLGKVVTLGLREGDKIKQGIPFMTVDVSGQPGQPAPVEVVAVRVRGAIRTPALYYLVAAVLLFAFHMVGLSRTEKARKLAPQPA